jgi:hypothetical protein
MQNHGLAVYMGPNKARELDVKDEKSLNKSHYKTLTKHVTAAILS